MPEKRAWISRFPFYLVSLSELTNLRLIFPIGVLVLGAKRLSCMEGCLYIPLIPAH